MGIYGNFMETHIIWGKSGRGMDIVWEMNWNKWGNDGPWANIGTLEKRWVSMGNSLREDYGKTHGKPMILKQYPLVNVYITMENHHFFMGKSTISMAIFRTFLYVYQAGYPPVQNGGKPHHNRTHWKSLECVLHQFIYISV